MSRPSPAPFFDGCMNRPNTDPAEERALIARTRAGDESAFAQLVTEHSARVYGALRRFGLDPQEADEVAQEVFLRAWRGLARFEGRSQFSTWLYRIAFNEAQRRLARRPPARAVSWPDDEDAIAAVPAATGAGPAARTLDREFEQMLEQALV
jgi:RNA polymerase sigma factor (sigma-70 family)